jgi:hypothetical protein
MSEWFRARATWMAVGVLALAIGAVCGAGCRATEEEGMGGAKEAVMFTKTEHPRIAQLWAPVRGGEWDDLENWAKHDLVMVSPGQLGMRPNHESWDKADGYTPESVAVAKGRVAELRRLNPDVVILCDMSFYELDEDALPEDHPWWLRKDGEREQFWPGTYRNDWYNADYQAHMVRKGVAAMACGADGLFFDNLRDEEEPWIAIIGALREKLGDEVLMMANVGYAIEEYDFIAPYMNGFMYESGWSHRRTEWDDCIEKMQHTETLFRKPYVSVMERFETTRGHAGWPSDRRKGETIPRDPAARYWSLCYALIVGDYYYLFSDSTSHQHDWYPEYDVKIGLPAGKGERVNSHVWRREYEKALVVMNLPGAKGPYEVEVERAARDSFTGETGTRFTIPVGEGRVLVWQ